MAGRWIEGNQYIFWMNQMGIYVLTGKVDPSFPFPPRSGKCILSRAGENTFAAWLLAEAAWEGFQGKWEENVT